MPKELPVLALSQEPTLEIGLMEGDQHYLFQNVVSVLPMPSGELAVADGGADEVTLYAPDGTFVRRWGRKGEGPGEFRMLSRLYSMGADSIMALDGITDRVSVFDTAGDFGRQVAVEDLSGDTLFSADVWLYGRYWVDGGLSADVRSRVEETLDRLPSPVSAPGYRLVKVASDGRLWIREPGVNADGTRRWTVVSGAGEPEAEIDIPQRFDPQYLSDHRLMGRWRGESDVNFVRSYDVADTGTKEPTPLWLAAPPDTSTAAPANEKEVRTLIVGALKTLASAQEIHYADHYSYTSNVDSLEWEKPEGLTVDFVNAGPRGWVAVFTHPGFDRICGMGYGFTIPPGWRPGHIICGPSARRGTPTNVGS
ncbi:MAG: hypothetical protein LJF04_18535 [Gemmatimonadetes bacterium]|nr:hypothetical protein [Gemmatimonadota bacterium]